jgi:diguanylate cyclase (GGDEF)-like protein
MRRLLDDRWRAVTAVGVLGTLAVFGALDVGSFWPDSVLGVSPQGWGTAVAVFASLVLTRFAWDRRVALHRERRLVEAATSLRITKARLAEEARTDGGTGLLNRRAFDAAFGAEFRRSIRYGRRLAVLMIDLDHFKRLNDQYGHAFGDEVLRTVASTLRANLRESDVLARYGGEEFVALLPETDSAAARVVGEKLREAIATRVFHDRGTEVRCTASVGAAVFPEIPATSEADLLSRADAALYEAKRAGRDRTAVASAAAA